MEEDEDSVFEAEMVADFELDSTWEEEEAIWVEEEEEAIWAEEDEAASILDCLEATATVADSILEERDVESAEAATAALLVNVELLLSIDLVLLPADADSSMEAKAVFDTEVLLPSSDPSLSRSLETVLLLTRGEV